MAGAGERWQRCERGPADCLDLARVSMDTASISPAYESTVSPGFACFPQLNPGFSTVQGS